MPTGGGKIFMLSVTFALDGRVTAIVISPLIALMKNQVDAMRNFSEEDGIAHFINSSLNKGCHRPSKVGHPEPERQNCYMWLQSR